MTAESLEHRRSSASNVVVLESPTRRSAASYDNALARQQTLVREARACGDALPRQRDELTQIREVLRKLFVWQEDAASRVARLTPRQHEIMEMVLDGKPSKVIAWNLGISRRTVENHRAEIMHRTGTKGLPELSRLAIAAAWDDVGERFFDPPDAPILEAVRDGAGDGAPIAAAKVPLIEG
jgi:DNA-binding CsgD family transcriptional regulator